MKEEDMFKEYGEHWHFHTDTCLRTLAYRWLSCTSISHAGSPLITWCLRWVTLICPALPIHGGASSNWLIMDNSSISRWLGQRTVHSCKKTNNHARVLLTSTLVNISSLWALRMQNGTHIFKSVLHTVKNEQGKCLVNYNNLLLYYSITYT